MLAEFDATCARLGVAGDVASRWKDDILRRYGEATRHYHTWKHVEALLRGLNEAETRPTDRDAVVMAIVFHDLVYDSTRKDNEQESEREWRRFVVECGLAAELGDKVSDWILQTCQHMQCDAARAEADKLLFLDLDLSVLGADGDEYDRYSSNIRKEYAHVPEQQFNEGRSKVLQSFLAKHSLYFTPEFEQKLQARARANIEHELAQLQQQ